MVSSIAPHMPMYPPGAAGIGQQFLYGQPPIIPQVIQKLLLTSFLIFSIHDIMNS